MSPDPSSQSCADTTQPEHGPDSPSSVSPPQSAQQTAAPDEESNLLKKLRQNEFFLKLVAGGILLLTVWLVFDIVPWGELQREKQEATVVQEHVRDGNAFLNVGEWESAKQKFQMALDLDKANPDAKLGLEKSSVYDPVNGAFDANVVKQRIDAVVRDHPDDPHAHVFLGDFYTEVDNGLAVKHYEHAIELNDKVAHAYFGLGNQALLAKNFDEALKMFFHARDFAPEKVEYLENLAFAHAQLNQFVQGIAVYEQLLKLDGDFLLPYLELAQVYRLNGQLTASLETLETFSRLLKDAKTSALAPNQTPWYFPTRSNHVYLNDIQEKWRYAAYSLSITKFLMGDVVDALKLLQQTPAVGGREERVIRTIVDADLTRLADVMDNKWEDRVQAYRIQFGIAAE